ncbi:MAG: ATP-dependent DNA helicase RecG [Nitrospinota bacterium]|nr:ATP-dependent DNA helicase RecG [Nitrospinota bacterium]
MPSEGGLEQSVQYIKGVGPRRAALFEKLGIKTIRDLLFHFPMRYEDRSQVKKIAQVEVGELVTLVAYVRSSAAKPRGRGGGGVFEAAFADDTGFIRATWFNISGKAMEARFKPGTEWIVSGRVEINRYSGAKTIYHPDTEKHDGEASLGAMGRITPVYPATEGLTQKNIRAATLAALDYAAALEDFVPEAMNKRYRLPPLPEAVRAVHWPPAGFNTDDLALARTREQKKLIFNEFFLAQAGLALKRKSSAPQRTGPVMVADPELIRKIKELFPFPLTRAQDRVLAQIAGDMSRGQRPMTRLLQGDVGSGKTVIALAAALIATRNKKQAAIMAPTEILAAQIHRKISALLEKTNVKIVLLTSASKERTKTLERIKDGSAHIVVGTHALIQDGVEFADLGMAVIDEQHRFGVAQRAELMRKGESPHTMIMTATPIPRTLAMTLYGDLDVSTIDELPPGRTPIQTRMYGKGARAQALAMVREQAREGGQVYIVYPLVEESEKLELKAARVMYDHLKDADLAGLRLGLVHGKLKSAEKEKVMAEFVAGRLDVLVSTTVIEVGVDVPNASVMMIEHAERFGLSQLHQLRGRVGRGSRKSHCLLITDTFPGSPAWDRMKVMEKTNDGFEIAEEDLAMRGSGDFFGQRQSGFPEFKLGQILRDHKILAEARKAAFDLVEKDPHLSAPEHAPLLRAIFRWWREKFSLGSVG